MNNNATPRFTQENSFPSQFFDPKPARKPRNHSYLDTLVTSPQVSLETPVKPRRYKLYSERLADRNRTKKCLVRLLDGIGEFEQSDKLKSCGGKFNVLTCGNHILGRQPLFRCSFRFCPYCAARRAQKFTDKYVPLSALFLRRFGSPLTPVHLTITQAHRTGENYGETRKRLIDNFRNLTRRMFWRRHFAGALVSVEATKSNDGTFHVHLHILGFRRRYFKIQLLSAEWLDVTGDSHVLKLREITNLRSGLAEVIKYTVKPQDFEKFTGDDMRQLLKVKGLKNLFAIGEFSKFCAKYQQTEAEKVEFARKEKADLTIRDDDGEFLKFADCPHCQKPLFEKVLTVEQLIEFARKIEAVPRL